LDTFEIYFLNNISQSSLFLIPYSTLILHAVDKEIKWKFY
jgi:hypothetical protein